MSQPLGNILVVDDDEDILLAARLFLKQHAALVCTEKRPDVIPALLQNERFDIILLDMNFTRDVSSGQEGFFWLDRILALEPSAVVILITAYGDVEMAVRAIKAGATDFVVKPWQNEKLLATLNAAMTIRRGRSEVEQLRTRQHQLSADLDRKFLEFVGRSAPILGVFATIQKVARTDANVLIMGENGTGKELVARELHRQSARSSEVFISVDMGALSESLFESELFGHVKGAFTDARNDRAGRFEVASGGTLFLDEIGNLPLPLQVKLLSVLQSREVTRLGSNKPISVDIRLICATNTPIRSLVAQKRFREDLLYRINTVEIHLPPLRERKDDIPLLVEHFLGVYGRRYGRMNVRLASGAMRKLERYSWPGNVRELQHAVERAVILSSDDLLQPTDFFLMQDTHDAEGIATDRLNLEEVERAVIMKAIARCHGNISQAAKELGLTRAALYRRIDKHGL